MPDQELTADVEIRIFPKQATGYPVELTYQSEREYPRGFLPAEIIPWTPSGDLTADGERLYTTLLSDPKLREAWAEVRGLAPQRRIRLRIDPGAAELHQLPWELLREQGTLLSANTETPFSRYLPVAMPWGGLVAERPIRVLAVLADGDDLQTTYDLPRLDLAAERAILDQTIGAQQDLFHLDYLEPPATPERLEEKLHEGYHILHFVGHGAFNTRRQQAVLYMQDEAGHTRIVPEGIIIGLLARLKVRPQLIFLAACQSAKRATGAAFQGLAPKLITAGVPAVVAMQDTITVQTARKLGDTFYRRLAEHGYVDLALNEARGTLLTAERPDASIPVLFMRLKSGRLWSEEADARGTVLGSQNPKIFWTGLQRMIKMKKCLPFIGPRVHGRWLPRRRDIAARWAEEHGYPFGDRTELAHVAQYLASNQGDDFPRSEIMELLKSEFRARLPEELRPAEEFFTLSEMVEAVGWQPLVEDDPNELHRVLADLDLPLYLTTNADNFMEEALKAQGKSPVREICRWNESLDWLDSIFETEADYVPSVERPLVFHLLGGDEEITSLVLTEDDYLDFLVAISSDRERIPNYIRGALANGSLMFLGYSLYDWEFRVIMRGLVATQDRRRRFKHVAVQLEVTDQPVKDTLAVQTFLQQYFYHADINVYWGTLAQFSAELREQYQGGRR